MQNLPEHQESLWRVIVSPLIWAAHFLLCYITAAVWCAKFAPREDTLGPIPWVIGGYTLLALAGIIWNGWNGYRRHQLGSSRVPHDADLPVDRTRFMGYATFLLAALSGVAVIFAAFVLLFFRDCQ